MSSSSKRARVGGKGRAAAARQEAEACEIDYTPHYEVLVKEGQTHFDSISAAIFEHIDNSITASVDNPPDVGRKIEVQIHAPAKALYDSEPVYLAIWDNACGMTTRQLEAYFTAALGRETRGLKPQQALLPGSTAAQHLAGHLSKFGVGALQSFAYLGTQLKVITKDREEGKVRWYKIDKEYFKEKEEKEGRDSVFKGRVRVVDRAEEALEEGERRTQLVEHMKKWNDLPSFTVVLIRMQDVHKREMIETQGAKLVYDLADVFYYYLKPEALPTFPDRHGKRPAHMIALGRTAAQAPGGGADKRAKIRSGQSASSAASSSAGVWEEGGGEGGGGGGGSGEAAQQPVEMAVAYFKEGSTREVRTDLRDPEVLSDALEGRYWDARQGEVFMGTFQVDDPRFVPLEDRTDVVVEDKVEVNVLARYYPFTNYRDTRPKFGERYKGTQLLDLDDASGGLVEPVVDVRWIGRKLPKAMYQRLYFFPSEKKTPAARAEVEACGKEWKARIHVTLFVKDWDFAVSNNKLNVQGDWGELLKTAKRCSSTERDLPQRFRDWIKACHKQFDRENSFEQPLVTPEDRPAAASSRTAVRCFGRVRYGAGADDCWRQGDAVRILTRGGGSGGGRRGSTPAPAEATGAGSGSNSKEFLGRISHFEVEEGDDLQAPTTARVYYTRLPEAIFGEGNVHWEPLTALDVGKCKLAPEEAERMAREVSSRLAKRAELWYWDGADAASKQRLPKVVAWAEGDAESAGAYEHLLVVVRDHKGNAISENTSVLKGMYSVVLELRDREIAGEGSGLRDKPVEVKATTEADGPCYAFRLGAGTLPYGRYAGTVTVLGPGREKVHQASFHVNVNEEPAGEPVAAELDGLRTRGGLALAEEMPLPAFGVLFKDAKGKQAWSEAVTVELAMRGFTVEYRGSKGRAVGAEGGGGADGTAVGAEAAPPSRSIKKRGRNAASSAAAAAVASSGTQTSAVGGPVAVFRMDADMAADGLGFEAGEWVLVPEPRAEGQPPLISADAPDTLNEALAITVTVPSTSGPLQGGAKLERELTIEPGAPATLVLLEPELGEGAAATTAETAIEVGNSKTLPTLRFRALDLGGNATAPGRGQQWAVSVAVKEDGVNLLEQNQRRNFDGWKVNGLGEVVVEGLALEVAFTRADKASNGGARPATLEISGTTPQHDAFFAQPVHFAVQPQRGVPAHCWLELRGAGIALVKGGAAAGAADATGGKRKGGAAAAGAEEEDGADAMDLCDDEENAEPDVVRVRPGRKARLRLPAGQVLTKPRVVVVDELGTRLDPEALGLKLRVTASSWKGQGSAAAAAAEGGGGEKAAAAGGEEELVGTAEIPDVPGPKSEPVTLSVQVFHALDAVAAAAAGVEKGKGAEKGKGGGKAGNEERRYGAAPSFQLEAEVHPVAGEAKTISFSRCLTAAITSGVAFRREESQISYRDEFKNVVRADASLPAPTVQWQSTDRELELVQEPPGMLVTELGPDGNFYLKQGVVLRGKARQIKLRVFAPNFTPMRSSVQLLPGPACMMKLSAPGHNVGEAAANPERLELSLCRGEKCDSLQAVFFDEGGYNQVLPPAGSVVYLYWADGGASSSTTSASASSSTTTGSSTTSASAGRLSTRRSAAAAAAASKGKERAEPEPEAAAASSGAAAVDIVGRKVLTEEELAGAAAPQGAKDAAPKPLSLGAFVFTEKKDRVLKVEVRAPAPRARASSGGGSGGEQGLQGELICAGEVAIKTYAINRVVNMRVLVGAASRVPFPPGHPGATAAANDLEAPDGLLEFEEREEGWDADTGPPAIGVLLETEDKEPAAIELGAGTAVLAARADRDGTTRVHNEGWYKGVAPAEGQMPDGRKVFVFEPPAGVEMGDPGRFIVRVSFNESRAHIKRVTPSKKELNLERNATVMIQHGRAVGLRPAEGSNLDALELSASNNRDDPRARLLLKDLRMHPIDSNGKKTRHESNLIVTIVTGPPGPPEVPPDGVGPRIVRGRVTVEPRHDQRTGLTTYVVGEVALEKDVGKENGVYRLRFDSAGLEPWFKAFAFSTDYARQQKIKALHAELNPLRLQLREWKAGLQAAEGRVRAAEGDIRQAVDWLRRQAGLLTQTKGSEPDADELREALQRLGDEIKAQREKRVSGARKPRAPDPAVLSMGFKEVVEVGQVPDRRLAELLSWYAGPRAMQAVICHTNNEYRKAKALPRPPIVYSLEDTEVYRCNHRTPEQIAQDRRLPLQPIDPRFHFRNYAVNEIVLRPEDEHLRQSVFWSIFGAAIILGTEEDALEYRKYCKAHNLKRPTILCYEDGRRLSARGPLDPNDKLTAQQAGKLPYVYGAPKPTDAPEYQRQLQAKERLERLCDLYTKRSQDRDERDRLAADEEKRGLEQRALAMEEELRTIVGMDRV